MITRSALLALGLWATALGAPAAAPVDNIIPLAGDWRFELDRRDSGETERWFARPLSGKVRLPVDLAAQNIGDPPSLETKWVGDVQHPWWKDPALERYSRPDNFKFPYWLTPEHRYMGAAWYQREIQVPQDWAAKRILLFLERPHWETRVWLDGNAVGTNNALGTPHEFDLGRVAPGTHLLTIRVDNRLVVDVGINSHSVSDHTQGNWNGIVGRIELCATPPVWIDDLQVYPDLAKGGFRLRGRIGNTTGRAGTGELQVSVADAGSRRVPLPLVTTKVSWSETGGEFETEARPTGKIQTWDEFNPQLYRITAVLGEDQKTVTTGFRQLSTEGTQFVLNQRKIFFRGTLECAIFPKTGHPPTDVDSWKRLLKIARAHGLNMLRFHSWCPPEAAFVAADELGFYFHVECSSWANQSTTIGDGKPIDRWIYEEADRMLKYYGNHPSFMLMPYGNEPGGAQHAAFLARWVQHYKGRDSRRLYTSGSGWPQIPENQFHVTPDPRVQSWGGGLNSRINGLPPETTTDYRTYIQARAVPVISHEIGQWCVYPNFDEIPKYTGYLKARNFEIFRDSLQEHHMAGLAHKFLLASGKLQTLCYKEDIEAALRTPGMGGFQLLDLHDFPGQGTALVGVLDPFWDSKGYVSPAEYSRFCNSVVPLARLQKRVFTGEEALTAAIELANFGPARIPQAVAVWKLVGKDGKVWAKGSLKPCDAPIGNNISLGSITQALNQVAVPAQGKLVVSLQGTRFENDWDICVYPAPVGVAAPPDVTVVERLDDASASKLQAGGKVLWLIPPTRVKPDPKLGKVELGFSSIFWNTAWTARQPPHTLGILCEPRHPLFASFPTDYHSNWQWWYLIHRAGALLLDNLPPDLEPGIRIIDDWVTNRRLGLLFEAKVGAGKLVVCSIDLLHELDSDPVRAQFRRSLLAYMAGKRFAPKTSVSLDQMRSLMTEPSVMERWGARVLKASSTEPGYAPESVLDGNPASFWHTEYTSSQAGFPHEIEIQLNESVSLKGFTAVPRQDGNPNGSIKEYAAYVSDDATNWGDPVASGSFSAGASEKKVLFAAPKTGRFFKLVALSGQVKGNWASLAELSLLPADK